ncbi:MAG: DUF4837 family protein [Bacteroidaceae bacterium]|nr:DUF4837 family protein [Bacteroidaceae bacterium]
MPSELLLVVDDQVWHSDIADTLKVITQGSVPGLMQDEAFFKTVRISARHYTQPYTTFHSKLFVHLDPSLKRAMVGISRDVVARPQIEVTVSAPNIDVLRKFLSEKALYIRGIIDEAQIEMRAADIRKHYNRDMSRKFLSVVGYGLKVPKQIQAAKTGKDFVWVGTNLNEKDLNIVMYTLPWDGKSIADEQKFVAYRDSVMRINIPGSRDDQWMQTTMIDGVPVLFSRMRDIEGQKAFEVRGLWEMRNGALGGPFVSLTRIDSINNKLIVAEGFVYSPSTDKRDLLRTVEASLWTLYKTDSRK